ncbi:Protein kinase domain, putative, partial [Plasmodium yoelii yoelii]
MLNHIGKKKKKIKKLINEKIEDYYIIKGFLPICEEFLLKNYKHLFDDVINKYEEKTNSQHGNKNGNKNGDINCSKDCDKNCDKNCGKNCGKSGKDDAHQFCTKKEETIQAKQFKNTNIIAPSKKRKKNYESDRQYDAINQYKKKRQKYNSNKFNLYECYVKITKKSLKEFDLPFDRAVLLNAIDKQNNTKKIIKIINKKKALIAFGETWTNMIEYIFSISQHKNLMKIYDIYDDGKNFYLIMEKLRGKELFSFLIYKKQIKENVCKYILMQILQAVNYLHYHNIIHRDIKPENLMFRNKKRKDKNYEYNYELVLIDYDTCQFIKPQTISNSLPALPNAGIKSGGLTSGGLANGGVANSGASKPRHIKLVGTYGYIAPEIIKGLNYSITSDIWSIGIILYILITGITPLPMCFMVNYRNTKEILMKKEKKGINFSLLSFNNYPLAKDLCQQFLQFDPKKRIQNINIASYHPWLRFYNMSKNIYMTNSYRNNDSHNTLSFYSNKDRCNNVTHSISDAVSHS